MVRGSIRGAKEVPPATLPRRNRSPVEAGKSIPGRIIWRVEYETREKERKRSKPRNKEGCEKRWREG